MASQLATKEVNLIFPFSALYSPNPEINNVQPSKGNSIPAKLTLVSVPPGLKVINGAGDRLTLEHVKSSSFHEPTKSS